MFHHIKAGRRQLRRNGKVHKNWRIIITGTKGYDFAQITSGGVDLIELGHGNNSLIRKGLYIIGELTNSQFECGGFNLNYAIFSGINAANDITKGTVKMIRINEIKLSLDDDESLLKSKAAKILKINEKYIESYTIFKKALMREKKTMCILLMHLM